MHNCDHTTTISDKADAFDALDSESAQLAKLEPYLTAHSEPFDLQHLGCVQETEQLLLTYVHLTAVHELQQLPKFLVRHVLQDHYRMLAWVHLNNTAPY